MQNGIVDGVTRNFGNGENGTRVRSTGSNPGGVYADSVERILADV